MVELDRRTNLRLSSTAINQYRYLILILNRGERLESLPSIRALCTQTIN